MSVAIKSANVISASLSKNEGQKNAKKAKRKKIDLHKFGLCKLTHQIAKESSHSAWDEIYNIYFSLSLSRLLYFSACACTMYVAYIVVHMPVWVVVVLRFLSHSLIV